MPTRRHAIAAAAATLFIVSSPAFAGPSGTLYPGAGYELVESSPGSGVYAPVGYMYPMMSYTLPSASSGGTASGKGVGLGAARLSTGSVFLGQRGVVITRKGSYALDTLGANSVEGWTPVGWGSSSAQAVSASGLIAGTSQLYSADGTQDLGGRAVYFAPGSKTPVQLPLPAGMTDTNGVGYMGTSAMSSTGVILGFGSPYKGDNAGGTQPLRWTKLDAPAELLKNLDAPGKAGGKSSWAVAANAEGTAVGWGNAFRANGEMAGSLGIRWQAGTTVATPLRALGTSITREFSARALAINDTGVAVGNSGKYSSTHLSQGEAAVRWPAGSTKPVELSGLGVGTDGMAWNSALAVNNDGTVAGIAQKFSAAGTLLGTRAVRWEADGTEAQELGLLSQSSAGQSYSYAFGMNSSGYIVGNANAIGTASSDFSNPFALAVHAVVWTPKGKAIDLNSLLPKDSGWTLFSAYSISDTGWVTGIGYYQPPGFPSNYVYQRLYSMQLSR